MHNGNLFKQAKNGLQSRFSENGSVALWIEMILNWEIETGDMVWYGETGDMIWYGETSEFIHEEISIMDYDWYG